MIAHRPHRVRWCETRGNGHELGPLFLSFGDLCSKISAIKINNLPQTAEGAAAFSLSDLSVDDVSVGLRYKFGAR